MGRHLIAALILIFAAVSEAPAQQQQALAGATRPRLQVLQSLPEAQLFPLMNMVATSLGVRCDYCHVQATPDWSRTPSNAGGWVWDRDDKAPKRVAREMMQMVVDLNKRFSGDARVTCYTCHRGSTHPQSDTALPPAPGPPTTALPTPLPSVDAVWTKYVSAIGKIDAAPGGTGTIISGWDERPEGRYGKVEVVVSGDRYRATVTTPEATTSQGLEGETGWAATNDRVTRFQPGDVVRLRRIAMRYHAVKERPANLRVIGVERLADRDVYVASARIDPATTWTLYFDAVTGLLKKEMTSTDTVLVPLQEQVEYDDYRDVGGVQMPFRVRSSSGAPYDTINRIFLQIRRNVPVDDAIFRPPTPPR